MNRRWFALVLIISLIPGCSEGTIETAPSEALYETKPADTAGFSFFYETAESTGDLLTAGLDTAPADGFRFLGDDILIFSGYPDTTLTLLDGRSLSKMAAITLSCKVLPEDSGVSVGFDSITYVDEATKELVFLNSGLLEYRRIPLPEDHIGPVIPSADRQLLFYCTADALRVMDLDAGLHRPVREMKFPCQELTALHCGGSVIQCRVTDHDGITRSLFLSAEDGKLLYESAKDIPLWTEDDLYFAVHMDGYYRELLSGSADFGPSLLVTKSDPEAFTPLLSKQIVLLHSRTADDSIVLNGYHLGSGKRIAQITLPEQYEITDIQPDPEHDALWLLYRSKETYEDYLYCWELSHTDPNDSQTYLQSRRSRNDPNPEGLAQCEELADWLSKKHGVDILLWQSGEDFPVAGYQAAAEYQTPLIEDMLLELDSILSCYPEGFLSELAIPTGSGRLNICMVRNLHSDGSPEISLPRLLHWDDGRNIWLVVTPDGELAEQVNSMLCDLIDSRVVSISDAYDSWDRSDPDDSAHPERVQMLETAMLEDREDYFRSGYMQAQLRLLCFGIRKTFQTASAADELLWEQHLEAIS